ncbi:MAG TPA: glyceraldehyde 3-phosphate dehydrogenase NAD-binding domain-containing protein [Polyangiaceae bacterium]|nr:glyceraldehyde 3-phosphate dehydrogenase NAD-binding domain-containing protein [Polyangiaceae bacterium]
MTKIAIVGFGRIGRTALRIALKNEAFVPAAVADVKDAANLGALFAVDTNYGRWPESVSATNDGFSIGTREIPYLNVGQGLPDWGALGIDLVIDCTGRATTRAGAQAHLERGARRVLVSAPSKSLDDCDAVLLPGINLEKYEPERHRIISMGSCTTNALAPVIKIFLENFGIKAGFFSTVHSYTNSQSLTDQPMKDRRDAWAAAENIIPSSSGAAKALLFIWKDLRISGKAYRVPTRTGSIVELNVLLERSTTAEEVRASFRRAAAEGPLRGILDVLEDEWSSARIVEDSHSSIVDLPLVQVMSESLVSVAAWYDNEYGFACRLVELAGELTRYGKAQR